MQLKKIKALAIGVSIGVLLTACQATDVVGKVAVTSFKAVIEKVSDKVTDDSANNYWVLESPLGDHMKWSKDFSGNNPDAVVDFDATPFINAGLALDKLPADQYQYDKATNRIIMPHEFGQDKFTYKGDPTALASFKKIVETHRDIIGYHEKLDHYGIKLGNGNMFEWAKDMSKNDKDMVFVLNPQPFIDAGMDPTKVDGWAFAKVELKDANGKKELVDKLLRPFNLD